MAWGKSSGRSSPLPRAWKMIRANVLRRDSYECQQVREDTGLKCRAKATDVDHMAQGPDVHTHNNLQSLCSYHHDQKTAAQGGSATTAAKRKREAKAQHPGVVYLTPEDD